MIPELNIYLPKNIGEIISLLDKYKEDSRIIAGGTDVVPGIQQESGRFINFSTLIDINKVDELNSITLENDKMIIGAAVKFSEINKNELIKKHFPLLAKAAGGVGSLQIRNLASIGGNFINNAPCADSVPPLLVYNAVIKTKSVDGERSFNLGEFLIKPYKTQLKPNEIVTQIELPILDKDYKGDFYKLGRRRAVSISRITLAVLIKNKGSQITDIRIASGAVTPIGRRITEIEDYAREREIGEELFKELARMMGESILHATGLRWSSPYKLPVVQQMFFQMLTGFYSDGKENNK